MGSVVQNNQVNLQTNWSSLNGVVDTVGGDVVLQGAAAGNMVDITTMDNTRVTSSQYVGPEATIGSSVNLDANNVWGNVGIQNTAICNGAMVSTDPILTAVKNTQKCRSEDPYSTINANVSNIAGNAVFQGSAIGNTFQANSNAPTSRSINSQFNNSVSDLEHERQRLQCRRLGGHVVQRHRQHRADHPLQHRQSLTPG